MVKIIMAHRGIFYYYKENSLDSILEIFNYKSNKFKLGVEFDINLTKDDNLIIYHDKTINNENINNLTYEQIKKYDNSIPKLEEVLDHFINKDYILNIEVKNYPENKERYCKIIIDTLKKYHNIGGNVLEEHQGVGPYWYTQRPINFFISTFDKNIYNIFINNNFECYQISEYNKEPKDIVHYSQINSDAKGVYTIFDEEFDDILLQKLHNIEILITDDIRKLLKYFDNIE